MGRSNKGSFLSVLPNPYKQINRFTKNSQVQKTDEESEYDDVQENFSYGLVLGQFPKGGLDQSKKELPLAYIIHFARTPVEVKEENEDEVEVEVQSLDQVDPDWIMEHAKRVSIMLPGGLHVLGIYVADEQNSDKVLKSQIVEKSLKQMDKVFNVEKNPSSYLSIHFNKSNGSKVCEILSMEKGNPKGRKNIELEESDGDFKWLAVQSKFLFDYPIVFKSGEESDLPIAQKIAKALSLVEKNVETSKILFNNNYHSNGDDYLDGKLTVATKSIKKSTIYDDDDDSDDEDATVKEFSAQILLDPQYQQPLDDVEVVDVSSRMRLSGRMALRAFLHPKATASEATQALKEDLLKSLKARCEMHCDSLIGEEEGSASDDIPVLHEPPRRVMIKLPESDVTISDFLFPGESTEASAKAVEEMFGFLPELDDLDDEQELVASPKQVVSGDGDDKIVTSESVRVPRTPTSNSPFSPLSIALSLAVAAVGVVLTYFYTSGSSDEDDLTDFVEKAMPVHDGKEKGQ